MRHQSNGFRYTLRNTALKRRHWFLNYFASLLLIWPALQGCQPSGDVVKDMATALFPARSQSLLTPASITPGPDLTVSRVDTSLMAGNWQTLEVSGEISARIENMGTDDATGEFTVTFFEDRNGDSIYTMGTDLTLATITTGDLASGDSATLTAPVDGTVQFRASRIFAFVDSSESVTESREDNNYGDSGQACEYRPPVGVFSPAVEWRWNGGGELPNSNQVIMTPVVIDLDGDSHPEVVFASFTRPNYNFDGHLRALNGMDGSEIWTISNPTLNVRGICQLAAGDIDNDQRPEIIAVNESNNALIAFENDGTLKWISPQLSIPLWAGPTLTDLDGNGTPEILIGNSVLNHDGSVRFAKTSPYPAMDGSLSIAVDLDLDPNGLPEIVTGRRAMDGDGNLLWEAPVLSGHPAAANFDSDPYPELAIVANGFVYLLEHDGSIQWGPEALPGGGTGGPPTIADFDNDGQPEIGVAGANNYTVFETDGKVKWTSPTQDHSSNRTGSSVFDFDGDGSAEVIYRDEQKLRIYRGSDGVILFETPNGSITGFELPVIADVDGDGKAEILMGSDDVLGSTTPPSVGLTLYGDSLDNWVSTRPIWNQHSYHVTNINDDGTIPAIETPNWQVPGLNNYRMNSQGKGKFSAPDLTASYVRIEMSGPTEAIVTARIGNGGSAEVAPGISVSFYDGDPDAGGILLGTVNTGVALPPGAFIDLSLTVTVETQNNVWVIADDDGSGTGTVHECDEQNNRYDSTLQVIFNQAPICDNAMATRQCLWPPDGHFKTVGITGIVDPENDPVSIEILSIKSDEPIWTRGYNNYRDHHWKRHHHDACYVDAVGTGEATVDLRAVRDPHENGRVYTIDFIARDNGGAFCTGTVAVAVPHDQKDHHHRHRKHHRQKKPDHSCSSHRHGHCDSSCEDPDTIDDGALYDPTVEVCRDDGHGHHHR